jgi:hypothetical protein
MIVYNLKCRKDHLFEAWFRDSSAYDEQATAGVLSCPFCGSRKVEKALMAPRLSKGAAKAEDAAPAPAVASEKAVMETEQAGQMMKALAEVRRKIEENFDHVGPAFAEEARKIHYGEADPRNIYGETSDEDAEALREEGVSFGRIPWAPRQDS